MEKVFNDVLVSIVLPIYNISEDFLKKCIDSLIKQTHENIEIILVDDGSTNNSLELCNSYSKKDKRIKVIHQENSGVSVARNRGLENSKGKYVCFIDPDDWVKTNYIEKLLNCIEKNQAELVLCNCTVSYNSNERKNDFMILDEEEKLLDRSQVIELQKQLIGKKICQYYPPEVAAGVPWAKMFKKDFLSKNNLTFIPGMIRMQDNIFCLYAYELSNKVCFVNDRLYVYRKEFGSACFKFSPKIIEYFEKYYEETLKFMNQYKKDEKWFKAFYMKELTSFNSYFNQYFFNKKNKNDYKNIKHELDDLLSKDIYQNALSNIDYRLLTNSEKIFVFLLNKRLYKILNILVKLRNTKKM
ncbi:MAG: glycosyltransferase [Tenericutes bacterium]|nr:glycosyltransferase [Mycoplasmatota bacterium]